MCHASTLHAWFHLIPITTTTEQGTDNVTHTCHGDCQYHPHFTQETATVTHTSHGDCQHYLHFTQGLPLSLRLQTRDWRPLSSTLHTGTAIVTLTSHEGLPLSSTLHTGDCHWYPLLTDKKYGAERSRWLDRVTGLRSQMGIQTQVCHLPGSGSNLNLCKSRTVWLWDHPWSGSRKQTK